MTDIEKLLAQLTLEEKAGLCTGAGFWTTVSIERLHIPSLTVSDGPHGLRTFPKLAEPGGPSLPATLFPPACLLGSTWNVTLAREVGKALAREAIYFGVDVILGPGVNIKRTPLCGRNFEYFSEDPLLAGEMAAAYIIGAQEEGVGTSLKHFACNNQEYLRFSADSVVDERTLREIYLRAFEIAVTRARPWTVMCAYNKLNGTYCSEHRELLTDILKNEWGFEGLVVSDWGAVHDRVRALAAGLDLEMPGPQPERVRSVVDAVQSGTLSEAILDEAVRRLLQVIGRASAVPKGKTVDRETQRALAARIAAEGIVLLKNDGLLPLEDTRSIAVIGRAAAEPPLQGGGSAKVNPETYELFLDEFRARAGNARIVYHEGYPADLSSRQDLIDGAAAAAREAEAALLYLAVPASKVSEGYDLHDMDLSPHQKDLIRAVTQAQPRTVVILGNGQALLMNEWIEHAPAVVEAWMPGQAGCGALADIILGRINPSGKLTETFPLRLPDTPALLSSPDSSGRVCYGEGVCIGYRWYDAKELSVMFPFGHGLSYTEFAYRDLSVSAETIDETGSVTVSCAVTNTGRRFGKEIVQLYVADPEATVIRPPRELKGFTKVALDPGETKTVSFTLDFRAFAFFHPARHCWTAESGRFDILIGASSRDIRLRGSVMMRLTREPFSLLTPESRLKDWLADPRGRKAVVSLFEQLRGVV
ncbi:MAG TPA: glycosyl hydrolase, partial [Spirochaetia bacterium]|nr:glycosyl hydrolase [Spirochaetia bacterium]